MSEERVFSFGERVASISIGAIPTFLFRSPFIMFGGPCGARDLSQVGRILGKCFNSCTSSPASLHLF